MAVYEKKLKGIQRFLPFIMDFLERVAKYEFIRKFLSYTFKFIKIEKVTRFIDVERLNL